MKAKELAQLLEIIVRKVVREELRPILTEVGKSSKPIVKERVIETNRVKEFDPLDVSDVLKKERIKKQTPKIEFSKNSMLNSMLSETYESGEWKNLDGKMFTSNQAQGFNRGAMAEMLGYGSGVPTTQNMTPNIDPDGNPMNVNIEGTAVGDALTRDYSSLMKTINAKNGK
jgi:hypothetical protein